MAAPTHEQILLQLAGIAINCGTPEKNRWMPTDTAPMSKDESHEEGGTIGLCLNALAHLHCKHEPVLRHQHLMTIVSVRIYYWPQDKQLEGMLTRTHWGFAEWFERRLKPIKNSLRGPEAKGVNIVNFMLYENPAHAWRLNNWGKRMNSFEYSLLFDFDSLEGNPPLTNVERLMKFTSEIAAGAPWPQVQAVAGALAAPLSDDDRASLLPYLQWPRLSKYTDVKNKKLDS